MSAKPVRSLPFHHQIVKPWKCERRKRVKVWKCQPVKILFPEFLLRLLYRVKAQQQERRHNFGDLGCLMFALCGEHVCRYCYWIVWWTRSFIGGKIFYWCDAQNAFRSELNAKDAENYTKPTVSLRSLKSNGSCLNLRLLKKLHILRLTILREYVLFSEEIVHPCFLSFCTLSALYLCPVLVMANGHDRNENIFSDFMK